MEKMFTDEELAAAIQKGDQEAFGILFGRYEKKILRYGRRFLYDYEDVQDAVQDVFIKAYENINSFIISKKFSTWLYRIAHNTFINVIKRKGRESVSFFDFDVLLQLPVHHPFTAEDVLLQAYDKTFLNDRLNELHPKYREPLILYYFEEMGYKEIADVLRIPISTVGIRLQRGKALLKKKLAQ